jgi:hypothetical protein
MIFMEWGWLALNGSGSPNFWWAVWVSALGLLMVGPLRVLAQRQELKGLLRVMTRGWPISTSPLDRW